MNKIFAALLVAGITAQMSGFISEKLFHKDALAENAYKIEVAETSSTATAAKPAGPEPILALLADADISKGEKLSKACAACHSFDKGGANKVGPNLWNIVGDKYAHKADFSYSSSLVAAAEAGGVWNYDNLNAFMWKPKKHIPGTKMNYIGIKKAEKRAQLIAWLRTLSDAPVALPEVSSEAE